MSAIDDLQSLYNSLSGRAGALDPSVAALQGLNGSASGAFGNAIANQNTAQGLSPEALSAMRTQATSGINDQYQSAAQALNSQLLRRGAIGSAQLPGSGGDISRAYQPLDSAMEAAKTKATTDTILADEAAKRQSLYQNQQLALSAANNVFGNQVGAFNAGNSALTGAAGIANDIGNLETPNFAKLLATSLLTGAATGTGPGGGLLSGGGTNGTGQYGVLGDLLGKTFGGGGFNGSISANDPLAQQALGSVAWPTDAATGTVSDATPALKEALGTGSAAGGLTGALGLGGGAGLLGLGAATIPVIGGAVAGIALLAKHFFGNGGDRIAANQLTGPGGVHDFWTQATNAIPADAPPEERAAAEDARDRAMETALVAFSKIDKDHYYQAKKTLEQFSQFSTVKPLLG